MTARHVVLAISGASGVVYGLRLLHELVTSGVRVTLAVTTGGARVLEIESGVSVDPQALDVPALLRGALRDGEVVAPADQIRALALSDIAAGICSGTHPVDAMLVAPCSMGTLARIVAGTSANVVERAADVMLKERRKLVLVPREAPLSRIHVRNMLEATDAGAMLIPASPGFYHHPRSIDDLVDQVVTKVLDAIDVPSDLIRRWKTAPDGP